MAIITAAGWKASRGVTSTGWDARLAIGIAAVEASVRDYCGRDAANGFEEAERTEVYQGRGTRTLYLREWPVSEIASVKYATSFSDGAPVFGDAVSGSSYLFTDRGELRVMSAIDWWPHDQSMVWTRGSQIQVVYTAGYDAIPANLAEACYALLDSWLQSAGRDGVEASSQSLGVSSRTVNLADERHARIAALLAPWRRGHST